MVLAISGAYGGWNEGWKRNPIAWSATIKFAMDGKSVLQSRNFWKRPTTHQTRRTRALRPERTAEKGGIANQFFVKTRWQFL